MQCVIVALIRSGAVLANQELLLAFVFRKNNWIKRNLLQINNKEEQQKKNLLKLQQTTSEAIKEQVSAELDSQLSEKVVATALKISPQRKTKIKRRV